MRVFQKLVFFERLSPKSKKKIFFILTIWFNLYFDGLNLLKLFLIKNNRLKKTMSFNIDLIKMKSFKKNQTKIFNHMIDRMNMNYDLKFYVR